MLTLWTPRRHLIGTCNRAARSRVDAKSWTRSGSNLQKGNILDRIWIANFRGLLPAFRTGSDRGVAQGRFTLR
jgi:hypothetical protein